MTPRVPLRRALLVILTLLDLVAVVLIAIPAVPSVAPQPSPTLGPGPRVLPARIVVSLPRAGARRAQSEGVANAVRLAVADANGRVSASDAVYTVEVEVLDSAEPDGAWSQAAERANVERAANDPHAVAYIGPGTVEAIALVTPIAARAALPLISPTLAQPALTKRGYDDALFDAAHPHGARVLARTIPADDVQAVALARWAKDGKLTPMLAVAADASPYAATLVRAFAEEARRLDADARAGGASARFVYVAGASGEGLADRVAALRAGGRELAVGGPEVLLGEAFLVRAGASAEGAVATFVGRPLEQYRGAAGEFLRGYRDRFGAPPDPYAIFGYDAARLVLDALRRARSGPTAVDRASLRDAVFATRDLAGALGAWSIDAQGDTTYASVQLYAARAVLGDRLAWFWEREISAATRP